MLRQALSHLRLARVGIVGLGWVVLVLSGPAFAAGAVETCRPAIAEDLRILLLFLQLFFEGVDGFLQHAPDEHFLVPARQLPIGPVIRVALVQLRRARLRL